MHEVLNRIRRIGIVPVIKLSDPDKAVPLARALMAGGIPVAEITFRADGADRAIRSVREALPDMLVGAGTVLTEEQVDQAAVAGAQFIVTPGFNPKTVAKCLGAGIPVTPGCTTASEIELALEMGLETVKFFPAEQSGGLDKIKALGGPFPQVTFMPTGGIGLHNLTKYLANPRVLACGGTFMVRDDLIDQERWAEITNMCQESVSTVLGFELHGVTLNQPDAETEEAARRLSMLLNLPFGQEGKSYSAGELFTFTSSPAPKGHFTITTLSLERAMAHMEARGATFRKDTLLRDPSGGITACFLRDEFCGFALELRQR